MGGGGLFSCLAQALWALFSRSVAPWHFQNTLGMSVDFTFCPHCHLPEVFCPPSRSFQTLRSIIPSIPQRGQGPDRVLQKACML